MCLYSSLISRQERRMAHTLDRLAIGRNDVYSTFSRHGISCGGFLIQRIGFVIPEGFQMIGLAAQAVFEYSNRVAGKGVYEVRVLSEKGGAVRSSLGIALQAERLSDRAFDTLIVIGTEDASAITTPGVLNFIRRGLRQSRRVASICTGAFRRQCPRH